MLSLSYYEMMLNKRPKNETHKHQYTPDWKTLGPKYTKNIAKGTTDPKHGVFLLIQQLYIKAEE